MTIHSAAGPTDAERLDQAVSAVLEDQPAAVPPVLAPDLAMAHALRRGLHPVPPGTAFESALARRLQDIPGPAHGLGEFFRDHHRLVLTGAVGSVVVSTAGVAMVAWRFVHRSP